MVESDENLVLKFICCQMSTFLADLNVFSARWHYRWRQLAALLACWRNQDRCSGIVGATTYSHSLIFLVSRNYFHTFYSAPQQWFRL